MADAAIVAVHYTVGTDLNPVKAGQYARNSFKPLNREARRLNLQVDKRYQVTDRLVHDIGKLAKSERADLLLLGAGPQFMQEHFSGWCGGKIPVRRLLQKLQRHSLRLPGELFRDKLQPVIENTESSVAIFVSRSRVVAKQFFLFLDGESDLDFFLICGDILRGRRFVSAFVFWRGSLRRLWCGKRWRSWLLPSRVVFWRMSR